MDLQTSSAPDSGAAKSDLKIADGFNEYYSSQASLAGRRTHYLRAKLAVKSASDALTDAEFQTLFAAAELSETIFFSTPAADVSQVLQKLDVFEAIFAEKVKTTTVPDTRDLLLLAALKGDLTRFLGDPRSS